MSVQLIKDIDEFLAEFGMGEHRFGLLAAANGRLVERLRSGSRVWPETEQRIRDFMAERRANPKPRSRRKQTEAAA